MTLDIRGGNITREDKVLIALNLVVAIPVTFAVAVAGCVVTFESLIGVADGMTGLFAAFALLLPFVFVGLLGLLGLCAVSPRLFARVLPTRVRDLAPFAN